MSLFRSILVFAMAIGVASDSCPNPSINPTTKSCTALRTGYCVANTDSSTDYTCVGQTEYKANAATIKGATAALCCKDLKCTGNTDASKDTVCPTGKTLKGNANILDRVANHQEGAVKECCEDKTGYCKDNKAGEDDHKCAAGFTLVTGAADIKGNTDAACCGKACSVWTADADTCKADDGKGADGAMSGSILHEVSKSFCCKELKCCGDGDSVSCGDGKQLSQWARTTDRMQKAFQVNTCCTDIIKDRCTGNTNSANDVTCPSNQKNKGGAGSTTAACCEDTCQTVTCPDGKYNKGPVVTAPLNEANCCLADIKDKCAGNTNSGTDFACAPKTTYRATPSGIDVAGKTDTEKQTLCCMDKTKYCTGNMKASEDVDCTKCHQGNFCKAKASATMWGTVASQCSSCCEDATPPPSPPAASSGTVTGAAVNAVVALVMLCSMCFF